MDSRLKKIPLRTTATSFFALCLAFAATPALSQALDPIITFDQSHPLVRESHEVPMVQIFSDGTVTVNRRPGNINPGQYVLNLNEAELRELTTLAQSSGIANFSGRLEVNASASDNTLTAIADSTTTIMQFNRQIDSATLSAGDGTGPTQMQTIEVDDVVASAEAHQDSAIMQAMKALHIKMIELFSKAGA